MALMKSLNIEARHPMSARREVVRRRLTTFLTFVFAALMSVFSVDHASAAPDPRIQWQVLETPHFSIVHDSRHYPLAEEYARDAERSYRSTSLFFKDMPDKTVLVLDDSVDLANGFATGLPYALISAFPVLPSPLDSISDYGDWSQELVTHEFTHVLQFEPANGLAKPLRWVFGNILRPNILLPRWYLEGLAVHMETRLSSHGRLRSEAAMAIPRAMAEENALRSEDISRLNEISIPDGVGGLRPYLLGGLLWNEIVRSGGENTIGGLNDAYSRRLPFFINGPAESMLGLDYERLLSQTYDRIEARAKEQIAQVERSGALKSKPLPRQEGFFNHSPVVSPDGRYLTYVARTHNQDDRIELLTRPAAGDAKSTAKPTEVASGTHGSFSDGTRRTVTTGVAINRIAWLPDSSGFVFDKVDTHEHYYRYSDLYHVDLTKKKSKRLTRGLRAREATVSPDGKRLAFVQLTPGSTRLAQVDLEGQDFRVLYEPTQSEARLSRPEFLSATELVFVEKTRGEESFRLLSVPEGEVTPILTAFKGVGFPRRTTEGLVFSSSATGIDNLYLADSELKRARAITNVTTRAITGEIDPLTRELYFSRLHADGPRIHVASKDAWSRTMSRLPQVGPLVDTDWPIHQEEPIEFESERSEYSAWPYMYPRYWMPFLYVIPGGTYLSASTSAADPLGQHQYNLQASYDTLAEKPSFAGQYVNQQTRVSYSVAAADSREYIYSSNVVRHNIMASLLGSFYLSSSTSKWRGGLGATHLSTELSTGTQTRAGPRVFVEYANVSQKGYEISPESGGSALLAHTSYLQGLGNSTYDLTEFYSSLYHSKGLPRRHAVALFFNAMYAPRLRNLLLGQTTSAADYGTLLLSNDFVMRGYANGSFLGRTMLNGNAEYRFPLWYAYQGRGTWPLFLQRLHGAWIVDAVTLDGRFYDKNGLSDDTRTGAFFIGTGAELRADLTTFYHLPVKLVLGLYYGAHEAAGLGLTSYLGFTL